MTAFPHYFTKSRQKSTQTRVFLVLLAIAPQMLGTHDTTQVLQSALKLLINHEIIKLIVM